TEVDRAGNQLRSLLTNPLIAERLSRSESIDEFAGPLDVLSGYRDMHAYPLGKVTRGTRTMIETELGERSPRPTHRFKRIDRNLHKLDRQPTMRLSQMEDIGGWRVVFAALWQVRAVQERISQRWRRSHELVKVIDYIDAPKRDGYRCVHLIVRRDGCLIEV